MMELGRVRFGRGRRGRGLLREGLWVKEKEGKRKGRRKDLGR